MKKDMWKMKGGLRKREGERKKMRREKMKLFNHVGNSSSPAM